MDYGALLVKFYYIDKQSRKILPFEHQSLPFVCMVLKYKLHGIKLIEGFIILPMKMMDFAKVKSVGLEPNHN